MILILENRFLIKLVTVKVGDFLGGEKEVN
jgi:hypothetical protein